MRSPLGASRRRPGFTLIELLVVISIIAVLIALLLPAVQAAREAARKAQCFNNLKQMGLGMHNYLSSHGCFPAGALYADDAFAAAAGSPLRANYAGWAVAVLPFMEQSSLYNAYNTQVHNWDPANATILSTKLNVHLCPSDVGAGSYIPSFAIGGGASPYLNVATSSYKGVSGRYAHPSPGIDLFWDYASYVELLGPLESASQGVLTVAGVGGVPTPDIARITDGTSNCLLVGEYATKDTGSTSRAMWAASWGYLSLGSAGSNQLVRGVPDHAYCVQYYSGPRCNRAFASFHPGGMNFLMADGHVKSINVNIDAGIYQALATMAGGEIVGGDSF